MKNYSTHGWNKGARCVVFPAINQTDAPRSRPLHPGLLCKALRISVQSEMGWSARAATQRGSHVKKRGLSQGGSL